MSGLSRIYLNKKKIFREVFIVSEEEEIECFRGWSCVFSVPLGFEALL